MMNFCECDQDAWRLCMQAPAAARLDANFRQQYGCDVIPNIIHSIHLDLEEADIKLQLANLSRWLQQG